MSLIPFRLHISGSVASVADFSLLRIGVVSRILELHEAFFIFVS